ncbi:MAG TPA: hypothetical protein PLP17_10470, partial [Oligoflexia bacterium]|nr:hypothetical protein [Oligoflexia bacterium]
MAQISLYFSSPNSPELSRVVFSHHALGGALESVRGKTGGAYGTARTFQWTAAVRALCVLLVETAARISTSHDAHAQSSSAVLEGSANTPASSLDYALGKNTAWLIDMFGETPHGKPLAQRLFQRSNPDRKRPGPAAVSLNLRAWDGAHISVFLDGRLVRAAHELAALSATIAQSAPQTAPPCAGQTQVMPFSASGLRETLRTMLGTEIQHALSRTDIFVRSALLNTVNKIHCGGSFRSVAGRGAVLDLALDSSLCLTSDRLGLGIQEDILRRQLCRPEPLRVAVA